MIFLIKNINGKIPAAGIILTVTLIFILTPPPNIRADTEVKYGRINIELYGGFGLLGLSDLNMIVDYDDLIQAYSFDQYLNHLQQQGLIRSWIKTEQGERKKINHAAPVGVRIRYTLAENISLSLGVQYFQSDRSADLDVTYLRNEFIYDQYLEEIHYTPYGISVRALAPLLGIHLHKRLSRLLTAEVFLTGGPLFAMCKYSSQWSYFWRIMEPGIDWLSYESTGLLEEEGSGTGISWEAGGRIALPVSPELSFFLEGGYAYQVVNSLSGSGLEVMGEETDIWEGEWKIVSENLDSPWGKMQARFPTNYPDKTLTGEKFSLDFSGLRVRIGLALRF